MNVLFVAPELCTPTSEGRKRFVVDLRNELRKTDFVKVLSSSWATERPLIDDPPIVKVRSRAGLLVGLLPSIASELKRRPEVICNFPHGTFHGAGGVANLLYMQAVDVMCRFANIPCLTVLYAIDGRGSVRALARRLSEVAIHQTPGWAGHVIDPGVDLDRFVNNPIRPRAGRTLLFLAGMWIPNSKRIEHVIRARGLGTLLRAGRDLAREGVRLVVATPFLDDPRARSYLRSHPWNSWPLDHLELRGAVDVPRAFAEATIFVFPYRDPMKQFLPTSIVEAMAAGVNVAVSDREFLRAVTLGGEIALVFDPDDPTSLTRTVLDALARPHYLHAMAARARQHAVQSWSIQRSATQLREIARRITR